MGCTASIYEEDDESSPKGSPRSKRPKSDKVAPKAADSDPKMDVTHDTIESFSIEEVEAEADVAIARARQLMSTSPRRDYDQAVADEPDEMVFETIELDAEALEGSSASDAVRLADEATRHARKAAYHRAVANGDELPQQWRSAGSGMSMEDGEGANDIDSLEELGDAPAPAEASGGGPRPGETDKERKKREKAEAKEAKAAEKAAAKEAKKEEKERKKREKQEAKEAGKADKAEKDGAEEDGDEDEGKKKKKKQKKKKGHDDDEEEEAGEGGGEGESGSESPDHKKKKKKKKKSSKVEPGDDDDDNG